MFSKKSKIVRTRTDAGLISIFSVLVTSFILLPISLVMFEISRGYYAQRQLATITDAAALAATTIMAESLEAERNDGKLKDKAREEAFRFIRRNSVMNFELSNASSDAAPVNLSAGKSAFSVSFNDAERKVTVRGHLGVPAMFGKWLGLSIFTIAAESTAIEQEKADVVTVFDLSGSMALDTPVTLVKRTWDASQGKISHKEIGSGRSGEMIASGSPCPPQMLIESASQAGKIWRRGLYGEFLKQPANHPDFRDYKGQTYPAAYMADFNDDVHYTHVIPDPSICIEKSIKDYESSNGALPKPELAYILRNRNREVQVSAMVELSHGSFLDATTPAITKADTLLQLKFVQEIYSAVQAQSQQRSYRDYENFAKLSLEPLQSSKVALLEFLKPKKNWNKGLVTYADMAYKSEQYAPDIFKLSMRSPLVEKVGVGFGRFELDRVLNPYAGEDMRYGDVYDISGVDLNPQAPGDSSDYKKIESVIHSEPCFGATNTAAGLDSALNDLVKNGRKGYSRYVILVTDGVPYVPSKEDPSGQIGLDKARQYALDQAKRAAKEGISIIAIGFFHDQQSQVRGPELLRELCQIAGGKSRYISAYDPAITTLDLDAKIKRLKQAFRTANRTFVALVN